ncbi:hypothetical protein THERMOT_705 [Bathymodiolus thermophilus thioautotrophic gill symbiont]|nr:hypothetical protein [Bathymodiolus thermophilus thioautotrophic gill symbiont]CAB5497540.1 hypothetical protein THERMOT_705 [Bathymodiolus thermophilus thioautotrophic gill symbiont]
MNNRQKTTFHPLGNFSSDTQQPFRRVNLVLALTRIRFNKITYLIIATQ